MMWRRTFWFFTLLLIITMRQAAAQDGFGEILLQAFTTGMVPPGNPGPTLAPTIPAIAPDEVLPEETNDPLPSSGVEDNSALEIAQSTVELEVEVAEANSPSPRLEASFEGEEATVMPSASPEISPSDFLELSEGFPEETFEVEESPSPTAYVSIDSDAFFEPIRVNCGSFDERSTFREDAEKWYNLDSLTAEDPFALARFSTLSEGVLYATYRYAEENLTYSIPLSTSGLFQISLHWAEIAPVFMREGARVFQVIVNGKVLESSLDVFGESPLGSFSPIVRSYQVDAQQKVITVELIGLTGQPMLSAFQVLRVGTTEKSISL